MSLILSLILSFCQNKVDPLIAIFTVITLSDQTILKYPIKKPHSYIYFFLFMFFQVYSPRVMKWLFGLVTYNRLEYFLINQYLLFHEKNCQYSIYSTAWPREIVVRDGHPLGLIEYMIERVHQIFCHLNYTNLAIFEICINPNGCPPLTFINPKVFRGVPSSSFQQPKGF